MCLQGKMVGWYQEIEVDGPERDFWESTDSTWWGRGLSQGSFPGFWFGQLGGDCASTEQEIMGGSGQLSVQNEGNDRPCQGLLVNNNNKKVNTLQMFICICILILYKCLLNLIKKQGQFHWNCHQIIDDIGKDSSISVVWVDCCAISGSRRELELDCCAISRIGREAKNRPS